MCKFKWIDSYSISINGIIVKCKYYLNLDNVTYVSLFEDCEIRNKNFKDFCTIHFPYGSIIVKLSDFDKLISDLSSYTIYNDLFLGGLS